MDPPRPGHLPWLPFTVGFSLGAVTWTLDGKPVRHEDRSGLHLLPVPDSSVADRPIRVGFHYVAEVPRGITRNGGGANAFILPSGVLLTTLGPDFLPVPGFVDDLGLDDGPRPSPPDHPPDRWRDQLPPIMGGPTAFTSHLEVDAPADLHVNAVGDRISERRTADRRIAVWQSTEPVRFLAVVAGRWDSGHRTAWRCSTTPTTTTTPTRYSRRSPRHDAGTASGSRPIPGDSSP